MSDRDTIEKIAVIIDKDIDSCHRQAAEAKRICSYDTAGQLIYAASLLRVLARRIRALKDDWKWGGRG